MNLVDSCGWLEYFANGSNASFFSRAIGRTSELIVPTLCLTEVFKVVLRQSGEAKALQSVATLRQGTIVGLDDTLALEAGRLSVDRKLPIADSIILATARHYGAVLWTQDAHFEKFEGVRYIPKAY
jgi:predicted nucleic acid-binding protein